MKTCFFYFFTLIMGAFTIMSCQKEIDGSMNGVIIPADQKPKVGTIWTYNYQWINSPGGQTNYKVIYHKAISEEMFGGEKWLKIVDVDTDTTVYFLNTKTDGLYQYTNNNAYLLCKYPAAVNDTYNTFNGGSAESFTVRGVNDTLATGIGNIPLSKYEGVKLTYIIDVLFYNKNAWIVWKYQYKYHPAPLFQYYLANFMFIDNIVY
jgi:hypothetical protein